MAHKLLGNLFDLPCRNTLHVHLGQSRNQRLLRTLIALKQLRGEPTLAVLWNSQLQLANPRNQKPRVIPRAIAKPSIGSLALLGAQRLAHLRFQNLLQRRLNQRLQELLVALQ